MNTNDSNNTSNDNNNNAQDSIEDAVGTLLGVGRMWARHGLHVAELALEASAKTLRVTAEALADASEKIDQPTE